MKADNIGSCTHYTSWKDQTHSTTKSHTLEHPTYSQSSLLTHQTTYAQVQTTPFGKSGEWLDFQMNCPIVQTLTKPKGTSCTPRTPISVPARQMGPAPPLLEVYCSGTVPTILQTDERPAPRLWPNFNHSLDAVLPRPTQLPRNCLTPYTWKYSSLYPQQPTYAQAQPTLV